MNIILKTDVQGSAGSAHHFARPDREQEDRPQYRPRRRRPDHRKRRAARRRFQCDHRRLQREDRESSAASTARREGVQIKLYSIIYELIDQVKEAMAGLLDPETRETVIGHAEVQQSLRAFEGPGRRLRRHRWAHRPHCAGARAPRPPADLRRRPRHAAPLPGRREGSAQRPRVRHQARRFHRVRSSATSSSATSSEKFATKL